MAEEPVPLTFTAFILSLATTAAVHFGDYADPETHERQAPNLEGASQMIDILTLLEQKTRGNLSDEESALLGGILYELRMRFVEVRDRKESRIILP
jgi:hypothetical protein